MYRGITVAPASSKLFESVLLQLHGSYLGNDPMQFGFKKNSSCSSALFTFTEAMMYCKNLGSKVYSAFLAGFVFCKKKNRNAKNMASAERERI